MPSHLRSLSTATLALLAWSAVANAADRVDFARDVLPILSENCFHCHGPDPKTRAAGLRLDTQEGAYRQRKGRFMILPGKSASSEVVRRVLSADPDEVMPPLDSNRKLTPKQRETLKSWIDQGAKWGQHWAFVPLPHTVPVPPVKNAAWPRTDLDRFILARLEREGLTPSPEASREAWLRRVSLDLTGLPPTLKEIDDFLADRATNAQEKVVDRLLASPRYGERMASDWLDVARYADTHGYQADRDRPMWPYRDWVIRAFNRNQRFDEFATWQLAGDLLPNATKDQRLATAFNRLHMQNEEGGIVEEEFRVAYVVDRVNTMGTAFLAMTLECSRCHDHKYDPLTMRDFYGLFAYFQNIDEAGQTTYFTPSMPVPTLLLSTDEQDAQLARLKQTIADRETALLQGREAARTAFPAWLVARGKQPDVGGLVGSYRFDEWKDNRVVNDVNPKQPAVAHDGPKPVPGKAGQGAALSGENVLPSRCRPLRAGRPVHAGRCGCGRSRRRRGRWWCITAGRRSMPAAVATSCCWRTAALRWGCTTCGRAMRSRCGQGTPCRSTPGRTSPPPTTAPAAPAGVRIYLDGQPAELEVVRDGLWKDITYEGGEPDLAIGYRFRDSGFKGGAVDEFRVYNRALTALEAAHLAGRSDLTAAWTTPADRLSPQQRDGMFELFAAVVHEPTKKLAAELRAARREHSRAVNPIAEAMVMEEMPRPKPAFVLRRGAYDAPGEPVTMNAPACMPPLPADAPRNRLGLARWLTHPDHPLTARVTVNRLWQQMFGQGLVETSDNFGSTGTPPTHPELLDWLARDFVTHGWDVKRFLKQIALSATYRQSAAVTPDRLAKDPYNQLLARAPARRLTAEMLRDQALVASGLLVEKTGGPSVYPYQPAGLWNEAMGRPHYPQSRGADLYRRSLYTVWKRTVPHPQLTTFDAADRSVCTVRRQTTSTPLQSLALLNDPQLVEAARLLGQRLLKEGGQAPAEQVAWAFRLITGRRATAKESAVLVRLFEEQKAAFAADPASVDKLLQVGETKNDPALNKTDLAAATGVALAILNHDGATYRR
ncbi:MAG: DUF1553 domain-containing protein [Gemmataceae bacterium]